MKEEDQKCIMLFPPLQVLDGNGKGVLTNECDGKHRGALNPLSTEILGWGCLQGSFIPNWGQPCQNEPGGQASVGRERLWGWVLPSPHSFHIAWLSLRARSLLWHCPGARWPAASSGDDQGSAPVRTQGKWGASCKGKKLVLGDGGWLCWRMDPKFT